MPTWLTDLLKDLVYVSVLDCSLIPVGTTVVKLPSGSGVRDITVTRVNGETDIAVRDRIVALDGSFMGVGNTITAVGFSAGSGNFVTTKAINLNEKVFLRQNNLVNIGIGVAVSRLL